MSRRDELEQLTSAWNDAWNSKDPEQLTAFFNDGATYYDPDLRAGPVDGKEGIRANAAKVWRDWPAASFEAVTLTIEDPRVILEWRSSAVHRTGAEIQLEGVDVLEWEGDKLRAVRCYYDEHRRRAALGQDD